LNLNRNNIGDVGAEHLANALQTNTALTTLDLRNNNIGPKGAEHLARALQINNDLTTLDLSRNKIGDVGDEIEKSLKRNKNCTDVNKKKLHELQHHDVNTCYSN